MKRQPKPGDRFIYKSKRKNSDIDGCEVEYIQSIDDRVYECFVITGTLHGYVSNFIAESLTPKIWNKPKV